MISQSGGHYSHIMSSSDSRFSITVLRVGSVAGVNGPVIFLAKVKKVHPRLKGTNLVTRYGLPEGYCVIPSKAEYMDDDTWTNVVKVVAPGIRKMEVSNVACVFLFYYLYI